MPTKFVVEQFRVDLTVDIVLVTANTWEFQFQRASSGLYKRPKWSYSLPHCNLFTFNCPLSSICCVASIRCVLAKIRENNSLFLLDLFKRLDLFNEWRLEISAFLKGLHAGIALLLAMKHTILSQAVEKCSSFLHILANFRLLICWTIEDEEGIFWTWKFS